MKPMKRALCFGLAGAAIAVAPPAVAALTLTGFACDMTQLNSEPIRANVGCTGWYAGDLNANVDFYHTMHPDLIPALQALNIPMRKFAVYEQLKNLNGSHTIRFDTILANDTIIGVTRRLPGDSGLMESAFYRIYFDDYLINEDLYFSLDGLTTANIYMTDPIPEPATWALMLAGIGVAGAALRFKSSKRRRPLSAKVL